MSTGAPPSQTSPGLAVPHAADSLVWGLEQVAHVLSHELDPGKLRDEARASLGSGPITAATLLESFRLSATSLRLTCRPVALSAHDLVVHTLPFPLVTVAASAEAPRWLILTERHGFRLHVQTGHGHSEWMDEAQLAAVLGKAPVAFFHCTPSTPMEALSVGSHSAQAVLGGEDGEDPHHVHLRPWDRLWALLTLERDDVWVVVIYSAVVGVLSLATPIAVQSLVTTVAFGTLLQPIVVLSLLFLVALGFQATLKALQARVIEALQARTFARAALDIAWRLPRAKHDAHPVTPELVNRFFDVMTVQKTLATVLTEGVGAFMQISFGLLVLGFYHPALLALDIVILIAANAVILLPLRRGVRSAFDESKAKYEVAAWLQELARAPSAFRGSGGAALAQSRADVLTRKYLSARRRHFRVIFGQTLGVLGVQVIASAVLLGFGGFLVVNESLTLGQLIAAELIVATVTAAITKFGKILEGAYDLVVGLTKVGHLIDLEVEGSMTGEALPGSGPIGVRAAGVEVDGVRLELEVKPGARLALIGHDRRELADLLAAVRQPDQGVLELAGVDVRRASSCAVHDEVMLIRPDDLFSGTVFENVSLTRPGVTPQEVRSAVERVGLDDEIRSLSKGYDTLLESSGAPLSRGQAIRLVVARALAASPRLIVVDDTLDALDPVSRARTVAALTRKDTPWTLIALVSDPGSALARACSEVRDVNSVVTPVDPAPSEAKHS